MISNISQRRVPPRKSTIIPRVTVNKGDEINRNFQIMTQGGDKKKICKQNNLARGAPTSLQREPAIYIKDNQSMLSDLRLSTPSPPPDDDDLICEAAKPDVNEIKKRMYTRECTRLGVTPVGAFMREPTRTELHIRHYSLGPTGARALSVPLMLDSTLTTLDLEGNALGPDGLANMKEMLVDHCSLTHLNLKRNNLGNKGALLICVVLQTNKLLESLNVAANDFDDKSGLFFANMLQMNTHLKTLDLSDNRLADISGRQLGNALGQNDTLENLDLSWNHFNGQPAAKLLEGVTENIGLKNLNLGYNCFGRGRSEKAPNNLAELLSTHTALLNLDISCNRLSDLDIFMISKGIKDNETLGTLKIGRNMVSVHAARALLTAVMSNENCKLSHIDMTGFPIAQSDLADVEELRSREVKVIHGSIHQTETDFVSQPYFKRSNVDENGNGDENDENDTAKNGDEEDNKNVSESATFIKSSKTSES